VSQERSVEYPSSQDRVAPTEHPSVPRPSLLVLELWGLGDLVLATPFLQAAGHKYDITLLAKPYAKELGQRFWPNVRVVPLVAPWTAFRHKYQLLKWPWREFIRLRGLAPKPFDIGSSARWDPRDHVLLRVLRVRRRVGFPRLCSRLFLTQPLARPGPKAHRYEYWRLLACALDLHLPLREKLHPAPRPAGGQILVHTGAGQPVRVWPLTNYLSLVGHLRQKHYRVQVACDPDQRDWWLSAGETAVATPRSVSELLLLMDAAGIFVGNDSGPAHLAGFYGVPTFTLFGPQLPEWFAPLHPAGEYIEGKPCPYRPCSDYCRFPTPHCLVNTSEQEVCSRVISFAERMLRH